MINKKIVWCICGLFLLTTPTQTTAAGGAPQNAGASFGGQAAPALNEELQDEEEVRSPVFEEMPDEVGIAGMGQGMNKRMPAGQFGNRGNFRGPGRQMQFQGGPQGFGGGFGRIPGQMRGPLMDKESQKRHETIFKLRRQTAELARQYRETENEKDKAGIKEKIKEALTQLLEQTLIEKEDKIKRLKKEIEKEEKVVSKSKSRKEKLVQKRLEKITGDEEEFVF